jgi:hypothetical protein
MGAWGPGVLDNDGAIDFLDDLADADLGERAALIRRALQVAVDSDDYLELYEAEAAIAAAAAVAAARLGQDLADGDGDTVLAAADLPSAEDEVRALAVKALDRVTGADSEWRELWEDTDELGTALSSIADVRSALI